MLNENELARQADDVFDGDLHRYKRAAQRIIAQLPTIEPKNVVEDYCRSRNLMVVAAEDFHRFDEPKRGKWIHDGSKWTNRWICSECGYKWFFDCIEGAFCPNCGADMRGEQDEY